MLEYRKHLVDLAAYSANGACACEHFQISIEAELKKLKPSERENHRMRCTHIHIAREHALDEVILQHLNEQGTK